MSTFVSAFFVLCMLSGSFAAPIRARNTFSAGASYFMTNDPSGNAVIAANIGSDGTLTLAQSYYMGGSGMRGSAPAVGPDALFSQGAIRTHVGANLFAAVNPGSNSISLFQINPDTPSELTAFGMPISSGGQFPMSLAFNNAGDMLCALNAGEVNGVQCFTIDSQLGLVSQANTARTLGMNQTTPPVGPTNTASQLIFTEDDSQLIVAVKGADPSAPGYLASWDVMQDGSLSTNNTVLLAPTGGAYPFSLTTIPGRNALLSADFNVGVDVFDLSNGNGTAMALPSQEASCWSAYSPRTSNFYVTDTATGLLSEVAVDDNLQPSVVKQYTFPNTAGMIDLEVASLNSTDYLYILMPGAMSVGVMALDAPGAARSVEIMDLAGPAASAGISMDPAYIAGMAVYVKPQTA